MNTSRLTRRLVATGALGVGVSITPILVTAFAATPTDVAAPRCTVVQTAGSASLACPPGSSGATTGGAPSEQTLTNANDQPGRHGFLGLGGIP